MLAFRGLLGENSFAEIVQILWSLQSHVSIHCLSFPLNFNLQQQREAVLSVQWLSKQKMWSIGNLFQFKISLGIILGLFTRTSGNRMRDNGFKLTEGRLRLVIKVIIIKE